jgi:hypothetical protein
MPRRFVWILLVGLFACRSKPDVTNQEKTAPEASAVEPPHVAEMPPKASAAPTASAKPRSSPSSIWTGESGGVRIDWTTDAIAVEPPDGRAVQLIERPKKEEGCEGEKTVRLLSVVGSIVSYEEFEGTSCEGAAHPSSITLYAAVDAAHAGKTVRLTDLFADADVLRALLADAVVKRHAPKTPPKTTEALVKALSSENTECEYAFGPDLLNRFAFHHVEGQKVAVRIGLSHGCEAARGKLTQLGILLPIPPALAGSLERASMRSQGFLMSDQAAVSGGKETRFRF